MLNISRNSIDRDQILKDQSSYQEVIKTKATKKVIYLLSALFFIGFAMLFLPWTQNIRARGGLTTVRPENREQHIHSVISGRIEKWFVREGQLVNQGDTIVFISEVKAEYLDPNLVEKTRNQANAKRASVGVYTDKAGALGLQVAALQRNQKLKLEQAENYLNQARLKVLSDSIDFETTLINLDIAQRQFDRQQQLYDQGLKSLTELESRRLKLQESLNKKISAQNKWMASKNGQLNAELSLSTVENEFKEKIAKAQSDQMSALSSSLESEAQYNKLSIQEASYERRSDFYVITAPQDGFVTKALITGIGETVKEGDEVFTFIPSHYDLAVELHVPPIDLPLIKEGNRVRLQFDGWPALVFSGWPGLSFGTYAGEVLAFDKVLGPDGKFRILVVPVEGEEPWPTLLRLGSGAYGIAMLKNVPIWYELWRNLNGFPPDFYTEQKSDKKGVAEKK
ncbi:MAG: HlyD family efflux transporter periplasmic adaptor subunit [Cyclobacteriaceae bacterium]